MEVNKVIVGKDKKNFRKGVRKFEGYVKKKGENARVSGGVIE